MARKLDATALGVAFGILWGACVLVMTWLNWISGGMAHGWFASVVQTLDWCYPGYYSGFWGAIWGGICGFVDGLICGGVLALLYNRLATPVDEAPAADLGDSDSL